MSKYNVGDKFIVEIESLWKFLVAPGNLFKFKGIDAKLSEEVLDGLHKVDSNMKVEDITDMIAEYDTEKKGYNRGLQDAWEVAKKFYSFLDSKREEIFDESNPYYFFENMQPQEALARLEAYEKEQEEIKVVDVCKFGEGTLVVTRVGEVLCNGFYIKHPNGENGKTGAFNTEALKKTGKHIDIQAVLQEIGGES